MSARFLTLRSTVALAALAGALALPGIAHAAGAAHTWISGVGDDANPCSRTAPCLTLAGALAQTAPGGLVSVLDPAELAPAGETGPVTINQAVTIDASSQLGELLTTGTGGLLVAAGASDSVVLKGLTLQSSPGCTSAGANDGITFTSGKSLELDAVAVGGYSGAAVDAKLSAAGSTLTVADSQLRDDCGGGVSATSSSGSVAVNLHGNLISHDGTGVLAGPGSQVSVSANTIVGNATGMTQSGTGALLSADNNRVAGNSVDVSLPPLTVTQTVTITPPAPIIHPASCRVPKLKSDTLTAARRSLSRAGCVLGVVTRKLRKRRHHDSRVYAQSPAGATLQLRGALVNVTIDARPPKAHKAIAPVAVTWVSGVGDDANPCSRTAPCRTLAGALLNTAAGGTINVLDPADVGSLDITKAVTIQGSAGNVAVITAGAGADGIDVDAGSGNVILRDLSIIATPTCSASGAGNGIVLHSAGALHIENVNISGFAGTGVQLLPSGVAPLVTVSGSAVTGGCGAGLSATDTSGQVKVALDGDSITGNASGVTAGTGAVALIDDSSIWGNSGNALTSSGNGQIVTWPDNDISPLPGSVTAAVYR